MVSKMMFAVLAGLLTGCATAGQGIESTCAAWRPIYVSRADVLSDGTAEQVLAHNLTGATLCGWRPAKRSPVNALPGS